MLFYANIYMNTSTKICACILIVTLFSGCTNQRARILGTWKAKNDETQLRASELCFNEKHGLYWHTSKSDSTRYHYSLTDSSLELMNRYGVFEYRVLKLSRKDLKIQSIENPHVQLYFNRSANFHHPVPPKNKKQMPSEKDIYDLIYALTAPNVELRLSNLLEEFGEGDYVRTPTLFRLTGVSPSRKKGEFPDVMEQRKLIQEIKEIKRVGNQFVIQLAGNENFRTSLPIYNTENGKRELKTVLDLFISKDAVINIQSTYKGIKIDIDGVRVGKGWLKVGLPTFRIMGDYGSLLGFKFYLSR